MKQNESSITSLVSAFSRAYHSCNDTPKIFDDTIAKQLITEQEYLDISQNMIQGIHFFNQEIAEKYEGNPEEILRWIIQVQLAPTPLARAAFCENILLHEIELGVKQYVILGAGLDSFSFRHPELVPSLEIFEMDHPATQKFKKQRLQEAGFSLPRNLHFSAKNFSGAISFQGLKDEGFTTKAKTFFSLLGVSYYLTKDELSSLLKHLFSELPPGSSIVFDYADERLFAEKGRSNRVENMIKMAFAGGEPMKSCYAYQEIEKLLEDSGLLIYEHVTPTMIQERYFQKRTDYLSAFETIHFIHAVKK
ncbi:class I SAM-dependent methyltransferase [Bacillus tuaregi]|uniref:class I SAM-dependent methyltransferase n=1 Tax=Bacillus tuaregi TaxID=1816695 RepID=UPI0008F80121|nr:class I SAM-dependent methyltransferase [Bacillus tuaregi]